MCVLIAELVAEDRKTKLNLVVLRVITHSEVARGTRSVKTFPSWKPSALYTTPGGRRRFSLLYLSILCVCV